MFKTMMAVLVAVAVIGSAAVVSADDSQGVTWDYTFEVVENNLQISVDFGKSKAAIANIALKLSVFTIPGEILLEDVTFEENENIFTCTINIFDLANFFRMPFYVDIVDGSNEDDVLLEGPEFYIPEEIVQKIANKLFTQNNPIDVIDNDHINLEFQIKETPEFQIKKSTDYSEFQITKDSADGDLGNSNTDTDTDVDSGSGIDVEFGYGTDEGVDNSNIDLDGDLGFNGDGSGCTLAGGAANPAALLLMLFALTPIVIRRRL